MDRARMVEELNREIAALTRARDALMGASDGTGAGVREGRNVSSEGKNVIRATARFRWAKARAAKEPENKALQADVKKLEREVIEAKKAMKERGKK